MTLRASVEDRPNDLWAEIGPCRKTIPAGPRRPAEIRHPDSPASSYAVTTTSAWAEGRQIRSVLRSQSHGATKSASDRRHGSPRRTVRIRLDIGGGSGGVGIGDCLKVPAYVRPASICRTSHRLLKLSSPKQDCPIVSPRLPDGVAAPPASLPLQRRSGRKDGGSVAGNFRGPLRHAAAHSMEPGRIFIVGVSRRFARIATDKC